MTNAKKTPGRYWAEPSAEWRIRAASLVAQLTVREPASGCVEGPAHVIGALMALFGYDAKNYNRKTRIYLTPAKWSLLGISAPKAAAPSLKQLLGL